MIDFTLSPSDRVSLSLSDEDYLRFSRLMEDRFGLAFSEKRRLDLEIGVRRAFATSTCTNLESYFKTITDPVNGGLELERLVNNLTIGESHFFRDAGQFDTLLKNVLPDIIKRQQAARTLHIWSAGCACGEEPYSIAMLLRDLIPDIANWTIFILATDINSQFLKRAHQALYGEWAFREDRAIQFQTRYFTKRGNKYELNPEIRRMVTFRPLNLAEEHYPSYETNTLLVDLIICRNVTIYFPQEVTRMVIDRFYRALKEGGWLAIGHSEHSLKTYQQFQLQYFPDAILYQRLNKAAHEKEQAFSQKPIVRLTTSRLKKNVTGSLRPPVKAQFLPEITTPPRNIDAHSWAQVNLPFSSQAKPGETNELEQASSLMNFGQVSQARDLLLRWLTEHPNHAPACILLGKAYANLGNWSEAERWCKLGIDLDQLNLDGYYTLALVFLHQGMTLPAIDMMKKVIYIDRTDILGHFSLANLYHDAGQAVLALKFLQNALRLLQYKLPGDLVPRSEDISIGQLHQTAQKLQMAWSEAGNGRNPLSERQ
jgi:chemotaxis protein methyltransferase CheR